MKKISFAKMSGAGNDFILFDKQFNPSISFTPEIIKKLCSRRTGIGSDGILVICDHPDYDFNMEYYNADGSTGSLCGNGARCAIRYAFLAGRFPHSFTRFISNGIEYKGEILDTVNTKFHLQHPYDLRSNIKIIAAGQEITADYLNTGSPHVIINIDNVREFPGDTNSSYKNINDFPVFSMGREIRYLPDFQPGGTNVNFIKIIDGKIYIRTFERGVEDETLACGTGSTAAAISAFLNNNLNPPVKLITFGGDELVVDFNYSEGKFNNLSLSGPAEVTFTGEFYSNLYFNNMENLNG